MAEKCPFYYYDPAHWTNSNHCCRLLQGEDKEYRMADNWADQYCLCDQYGHCPYYSDREKTSSGGSGCYLTFACTQAMGLPDDCYELQTLRRFRDHYLKALPNGERDIREYYETAPRLIARIDQQLNRLDIYKEIYSGLVVPCVRRIEHSDYFSAYQLYKAYSRQLFRQYLTDE